MEGWYSDPYDGHEARWISHRTPTSLVRDKTIEGKDPVARRSFSINPVSLEGTSPKDANWCSLADVSDQEVGYDPKEAIWTAWDLYDRRFIGP
jgi:hypothetical protein